MPDEHVIPAGGEESDSGSASVDKASLGSNDSKVNFNIVFFILRSSLGQKRDRRVHRQVEKQSEEVGVKKRKVKVSIRFGLLRMTCLLVFAIEIVCVYHFLFEREGRARVLSKARFSETIEETRVEDTFVMQPNHVPMRLSMSEVVSSSAEVNKKRHR